jgi:hypothetical protein
MFHQGKTIVPAFFRDRLYVFFTNLFGLIASRDRPHEASSDAAARRGFALSPEPGEDNAATGDLDIHGSVTIKGAGANSTTIDANSLDRVFQIFSGKVTIDNTSITGNTASTSDNDVHGTFST